jgi:hypothetical protein
MPNTARGAWAVSTDFARFGAYAMAAAVCAFPSIARAQCAGNSDQVSAIANAIMQPSACWSCQLYGSVYSGMHAIVTATYQSLVSGPVGATVFGITIVGIAIMTRMLPFLIGTGDPLETIASMRLFFFRIAVAFLGFLTVGSASTMSDNGIASNWFVDGPLAAGTALGQTLSTATASALATASGTAGTNLFGGTGGAVPAACNFTPGSVATGGTGMQSFATMHCQAATSMLYNLHRMGTIGIDTAMWLLLEDPSVSFWQPGTSAVIIGAGLFLAWTFFLFTVSFGLRYIDALIRAMLIFSLTPVFVFLWIFDSTRSMAVQALKSGFALSGVFAISGIVYSIAYYILLLGYQNAFQQQGLDFQGLMNLVCGANGGAFAQSVGSTGQGGSLNWMAYFYLVGSGSLATACASLTFDLAAQIFDFGNAEMGVGQAVQRDATSTVQTITSVVGGR